MPRLVVHQGDAPPREIQLRPGIQRFGRRPDNDHCVEDGTVSGAHCEIEVTEAGVRVRDLGSTNGTFIQGVPVTDAWLPVGETLYLGGVACQLVADDPPPVVQAPPPPAEVRVAPVSSAPDSGVCASHPGVAAAFLCGQCGAGWCRSCIRWLRAGMRQTATCPSCGGFCSDAQQLRKEAVKRGASFFSYLPDSFGYPLRKNGLILLICGTVFFGGLEVAQLLLMKMRVGFLALAYWIAAVMSTGYLYSFMQNIIVSSGNGEEDMPGFPEVSDFVDGFAMPALRVLGIGAVLCGPGLAVWVGLQAPLLGLSVLALGLFCMPMALLTVSLADSLAGLNPAVIFSGIAKVPGPYLVTWAIFVASVAIYAGARALIDVLPIPLLPIVAGTFVFLYLLTVSMRVLGVLYFTHRDKLAWFD